MDLDAMPLHLSGNNSDAEDLDGFDFALGDDVQDDRLFASGSSDMMMEVDMLNARGGTSSYQYGGNYMHFDSIHEHLDGTPMNSSSPRRNRHRRTKRERSASPQGNNRRFNGINFDPLCRRQASHGDLSHAARAAGVNDLSQSQYTEALTKLAASMRQTQESREYMVKMKREVFSSQQQKLLEMAKEQLKKENEEAAKKVVTPPTSPPQEIQIVQPPRDNSPGRSSSILNGFLSSRRGTLTSVTSGLEKYMGTMNQKTL